MWDNSYDALDSIKFDETAESSEKLTLQNSLDKLNDQQLIHTVHSKEIELKHLRLENKMFINFIYANDPSEMEGFDNLVDFAMRKVWNTDPRYPVACQDFMRTSILSGRRSIQYDSFSSISSVFEGKGPKINLSQKSDMILKAMEEVQSNLLAFEKKSHRTNQNYKSELEEYAIREKDIKDAIESFEYTILVQGFNRLTQRIPAEKFVRWMEEWLRSAQLTIEKLRLRTASLKIQYKKVSTTLIQRQELRENVHAVDFDQLEIENKHFSEKLELKNIQLIEMKKMSGNASLVLNNNKKEMRRQQDEYNWLKGLVVDTEKIIEFIEDECEKIEEELQRAEEKYNSFKKLTISYKVPNVLEYVDIKRQLNDLKNEMKVWHRRKKIQDITINACMRQMKNITGSPKMDHTWLEDFNAEGAISNIDDDDEEEDVDDDDNAGGDDDNDSN